MDEKIHPDAEPQDTDNHYLEDSGLEPIVSEQQDLDSSPARYEIVTYPADYTLEGIVSKYRKGQITIPGFQRKFVWTLPQASKLIESFLLGLPVPAVFLYADPDDASLQVIDGQQRLLSIVYFFDGYFGPQERGRRTVFSLTGLNESSPYSGLTYEQLAQADEGSTNRLNDSVLRAFIVKQLDPKDNTSIFHIFERLNTGGTQLVSQEIRNCVYHGAFNSLLNELNRHPSWRKLYGKAPEDKRQRDRELILRFLALLHDQSHYEKPMKDFLSRFMSRYRRADDATLDAFAQAFRETSDRILAVLGPKPFHVRAGLNAAVFDSVACAFASALDRVPPDISDRYGALVEDPAFSPLTASSTTDKENVAERLRLARERLFG